MFQIKSNVVYVRQVENMQENFKMIVFLNWQKFDNNINTYWSIEVDTFVWLIYKLFRYQAICKLIINKKKSARIIYVNCIDFTI